MTTTAATPHSVDNALRRGCAAVLAGLPSMGPRRLTALLDAWGPVEAWERAVAGGLSQLVSDPAVGPVLGPTAEARHMLLRCWATAAHGIDPADVAARHQEAGVLVHLRDDPSYPETLLADVEPPAVLFTQGRTAALAGPRVAIVGTRRCTGVGAGFARELGRELATAGVSVVSGLALGIDGAAHRGALDAAPPPAVGPIGVVGSGLDVVYPARHWDLWQAVGAHGLLLGEVPLGLRPAGWRFPARNRIIAALADVVVVVESHAGGGSLHTVAEAIRRDIQVMAVPGSVRSPAAAGTNQLLADGCHPVRDTGDVLVALGLTSAGRRRAADRRASPDAAGRAVLDAFDWEPATFEHLAVRTSLALPDLAIALEWLQAEAWVELSGGWYERVGAP